MTTPNSEPEQLQAFSRKKVAIALDCSVATVDRMVKRGDLHAFKLHGGTRITASSLEALMARSNPELPPPAMTYAEQAEHDYLT